MKSPTFALPLLAAFAGASREAWDEVCPSKDGQTEATTDYGREVTYLCGQQFPPEHLLETAAAADAEACVSSCLATAGCVGSHWVHGTQECELFSAGGDALSAARGAVALLLSGEDEDAVASVDEQTLFGGSAAYEYGSAEAGEAEAEVEKDESRSCRSCKKLLSDCEESEARLEGSLDTCKQGTEAVEGKLKECEENGKKTAGGLKKCQDNGKKTASSLKQCQANTKKTANSLKQCQANSKKLQEDKKKLQGQVASLQKQVSACPKPLNHKQVCPAYKNMLLRQGGGTWRISCQQGPVGRKLSSVAGSFESCLEACARDKRCSGANYWAGSKLPCTTVSHAGGLGTVVREPLVGARLVGRY